MPAQKITPFLWFNDTAEQAAKFYVALFKKDSKILHLSRYGDCGPGKPGSVMVAKFRAAGLTFCALNGGPHYKITPAISFVVNCKDQREVDRLWKALARGGQELQCGWVTDKFGVSWQIIPDDFGKMMSDPDPAKSARVMQAMMTMVKLDVKKLRRAYEGR